MEQNYQELLQAIAQMLDQKLDGMLDQKLDKMLDEKLDRTLDTKFSTWKDEIVQTAVKEAVHQSGILMEAKFQRQFDLLNEKMDTMLDRKASYESLEDLTDRVDTLENFTLSHARRIARLEKAAGKP